MSRFNLLTWQHFGWIQLGKHKFCHNFPYSPTQFTSEIMLQKQSPEVFCKRAVFKDFVIFIRKHLCWSLFLIKLQTRPATLLRRDSHTSLLLWILSNFQENLFWRRCEQLLLTLLKPQGTNYSNAQFSTMKRIPFCKILQLLTHIYCLWTKTCWPTCCYILATGL